MNKMKVRKCLRNYEETLWKFGKGLKIKREFLSRKLGLLIFKL